MNSWAFEQLNRLTPSPGTSPANGPAAEADRSQEELSFPVSGSALQAQLEQWTNVAFDFEPISPQTKTTGLKAQELDFGFNSALDPYGPIAPSLVDPTLSMPSLVQQQSQLPMFGTQADDFVSALGLPVVDDEPSAAPAAVSLAPTKAPAKRKRVSAAASTSSPASASVSSVLAPAPAEASTSATPASAGADDDALNALAVEEDKRRRNTAASARFRVKKKMREAALETTAKELRDKVDALEREVEALRTENGWLKGMLVDSNADETNSTLKPEQVAPRKRQRVAEIKPILI